MKKQLSFLANRKTLNVISSSGTHQFTLKEFRYNPDGITLFGGDENLHIESLVDFDRLVSSGICEGLDSYGRSVKIQVPRDEVDLVEYAEGTEATGPGLEDALQQVGYSNNLQRFYLEVLDLISENVRGSELEHVNLDIPLPFKNSKIEGQIVGSFNSDGSLYRIMEFNHIGVRIGTEQFDVTAPIQEIYIESWMNRKD